MAEGQNRQKEVIAAGAPGWAAALGAAGATLGIVQGLLTNDHVGQELRAAIPPDLLAELLERIRRAGVLVDRALEDYQAEQMRLGKN